MSTPVTVNATTIWVVVNDEERFRYSMSYSNSCDVWLCFQERAATCLVVAAFEGVNVEADTGCGIFAAKLCATVACWLGRDIHCFLVLWRLMRRVMSDKPG